VSQISKFLLKKELTITRSAARASSGLVPQRRYPFWISEYRGDASCRGLTSPEGQTFPALRTTSLRPPIAETITSRPRIYSVADSPAVSSHIHIGIVSLLLATRSQFSDPEINALKRCPTAWQPSDKWAFLVFDHDPH